MFTTLVAGHVCLDLTPGLTRAGLPRPGELVPSGPLELTVGGCVGNTGVVPYLPLPGLSAAPKPPQPPAAPRAQTPSSGGRQ